MTLEQILPKDKRVSRELLLDGRVGPLDMKEIFGNDNPVELEIGIGKGYFIQFAAKANPDHNFIGIEYSRKYHNMARDRVEKRPIPNVRFVCCEAFGFLSDFIKPTSLECIHLYFPDPWHKKRHHKRRLFSPEFIKLVFDRLKEDGLLLIATDHRGYWEHMCEVLAAQTLLERCEQLPAPPVGADGLTSYEIKYQREGREIFRTGYRKPKP